MCNTFFHNLGSGLSRVLLLSPQFTSTPIHFFITKILLLAGCFSHILGNMFDCSLDKLWSNFLKNQEDIHGSCGTLDQCSHHLQNLSLTTGKILDQPQIFPESSARRFHPLRSPSVIPNFTDSIPTTSKNVFIKPPSL